MISLERMSNHSLTTPWPWDRARQCEYHLPTLAVYYLFFPRLQHNLHSKQQIREHCIVYWSPVQLKIAGNIKRCLLMTQNRYFQTDHSLFTMKAHSNALLKLLIGELGHNLATAAEYGLWKRKRNCLAHDLKLDSEYVNKGRSFLTYSREIPLPLWISKMSLIDGPMDHIRVGLSSQKMLIKPLTPVLKWLWSKWII